VPRSHGHGNARKKKARLTDQTFSDVMAIGHVPPGPAAVELREREARESGTREPGTRQPDQGGDGSLDVTSLPVVSSILDLWRSEPDEPVIPAVYNDPGHVLKDAAGFPADHFAVGLVACPECRNEMFYYQDRAVLAEGYRFRCRICQHELLAVLP